MSAFLIPTRLIAWLSVTLFFAVSPKALGACGATTYVWQPNANTTAWTTTNNWSPTGFPNANTENAYIQADWQVPAWPNASYNLACLEIASGAMTATPGGNRTLTISGDYFKNPNPGSLTTNAGFTIVMAGTAAQTFQNVDPINNLTISNSSTTTLPDAFTVSGNFTISAGAGTIQVQSGLTLSNAAAAVTIPASATLDVQSGATLVALGGLIVNGTLKIGAGASVLIGNGKTLSVPAGGVLKLNGTSGNAAIVDADQGSSTYAISVAGALNANYFSISRTSAAGLNVTGTVQALSNGDFHYVASGGYAITLATAVNIPTPNPSGLGFFDDFAYGNTKNFNATGYTGTAFTVNNWSGLGGAANETDPANKVSWGAQSPVALQVTNRTASGFPGATIAKGSAATLFATFAFSLNGPGTASDITSVKLTLDGFNLASDVAYAQVMNDTNNNCTYQAGTDLQIGGNLTFTGSPATTTVTIPSATLSVNSTALKCLHVLLVTNANALTGDTLKIKIAGTADVVNSQGYSFSNTSGPPVQGASSTITGTAVKIWGGGNGPNGGAQNWNANAGDWTPAGAPAATNDCQIGPGYSYPAVNGNYTCTNLVLPTSGTMSWGGTTNTLTLLGGLNLGGSYTFLTATTGNLAFASTTGIQSITAQTTFPGNVIINNTAGGANSTVSVDSSWTIGGNLTLTAGILRITSGVNLTVSGNITVNGGTLKIDPGGTLTLGDGKTLTVNAAGTLEMVGSTAQNAAFTCAGTTTGCAIAISGTIKAQYYSLSKLAVSGMTINAGATVDTTYYLQNGSFLYPVGTNPALLTLNRQIPGNALANMTFDKGGSSATGAKSIVTSAAAGTLNVSNYSGDLTNCCTTAPVYLVSWSSPTNTLKVTAEDLSGTVTVTIATPGVLTWNAHGLKAGAAVQLATTGALPTGLTSGTTYYVAATPTPTANTFSLSATSGGAAIATTGTQSGVHSITATVNNADQGDTAMRAGWFSFQQTQAGSFANTDITSIKFTLSGTGSASDVSSARLYYDSGCTGTGGTQVGSTLTFTGSPPTLTFSGLSGVTVPSSLTAPPKRCVYVEFDVASTATAGATLVASIAASTDVVNTQGYAFNGSYSPPESGRTVTIIGNTITWSGATSTAWATATNWIPNTVIPDATKNCVINAAARNPIISAAGAVCKSLTIGNGTLTINATRNLDVYGSITNTGTIVQGASTATITVRDNGSVPVNNTLQSSSALNYLVFNKTAGGYVYIGNSNLTINNFAIAAGNTFTFGVRNGDTLTLPNGGTLTSATFLVEGGGTVAVTSGQTLTVNGATFRISGTNDGYPQSLSNKGTLTRNGASGTWSFLASSGTVDLTGWVFDWLDCNGLLITGTTTLTNLNGGQFTDLPLAASCGTTLKALQINTTGTIPATADYVGFNWGASNAPPAIAAAYWLGFSSGCASQTMSFTNWFGDFFVAVNQPVAQSKISNTTCNLTMTAAASPVTLTEFRAIPYHQAVLLDWVTGMEILHSGFNVYRSELPETGAVQINAGLLRNPLASGTVHGHYQFFDRSVVNGRTYYYWIEDISTTGKRTRHGPLSASPLPFLGEPPAPQSNAITGTQASTTPTIVAPTPTAFAPGQVTLAPGVTLLAQNARALRVRVQFPPLKRTPARTPYEHVSMEGFSVGGEAGRPEQLERTIYLEIPRAATAQYKVVGKKFQTASALVIAPNSGWAAQNGSLVPSAAFDSAYYATEASLPHSPLALGTPVDREGGSTLPVTVLPLAYNPAQKTAEVLTELTFDIFLGEAAAWNHATGANSSNPFSFENGIKVRFSKTGLYQLSYDDFVMAGVDGPYSSGDCARLRLFHGSAEIPLEVECAGGSFGPGTTLRFFVPFVERPDDALNTVVLILDREGGKRMGTLSGAPTGRVTDRPSFTRRLTVKKASFAFFNEPFGEGLDHILWGRFYSPPNTPGEEKISTSIALPALVDRGDVAVKVYVKGSAGGQIKNPIHHLRLRVNGVAVGDDEFQSNEPRVSVFRVPAGRFVPSLNALEVEAVGSHTGKDYDILNLERFVLDYPHDWVLDEGAADILNYQPGRDLVVRSPGADVRVYDVTRPDATARVEGVASAAVEAGYQIQFGTVGGDATLGRRFWVVDNAAMLRPTSLELSVGSQLTDSKSGADVLYVGPKTLLPAIKPLAEFRQGQGFRTALVDLESIYMEFGQGDASPAAIKAFLKRAFETWAPPAPRYVVLLGDATVDPKNQLHFNPPPFTPVPLSRGLYLDYGNDNWFVAFDADGMIPRLAIGRIPGNTPELIRTYAQKVIRFEQGLTRPEGRAARQFTLINDQDQVGGENFRQRADALAAQVTASPSPYTVNRLVRGMGTDGELNSKIVDAFEKGSAIIHYIGHGAEDRWASAELFRNLDADRLVNKPLPFVVAMNCLNAYFYDADPAYQSLADRLIFNPEGGAIAFWGSTSLTAPSLQDPFQNALYEMLRDPKLRLGDAIRLAKSRAGVSAGTAEIVGSWTLLGDPMLQLALPTESRVTQRAAVGSCASAQQLGKSTEPPGWEALLNLVILVGTLVAGRRYSREVLRYGAEHSHSEE